MKHATLVIPITFPSDLSDEEVRKCLNTITKRICNDYNEDVNETPSFTECAFFPETIGNGWKRQNKFIFYFGKWGLK